MLHHVAECPTGPGPTSVVGKTAWVVELFGKVGIVGRGAPGRGIRRSGLRAAGERARKRRYSTSGLRCSERHVSRAAAVAKSAGIFDLGSDQGEAQRAASAPDGAVPASAGRAGHASPRAAPASPAGNGSRVALAGCNGSAAGDGDYRGCRAGANPADGDTQAADGWRSCEGFTQVQRERCGWERSEE